MRASAVRFAVGIGENAYPPRRAVAARALIPTSHALTLVTVLMKRHASTGCFARVGIAHPGPLKNVIVLPFRALNGTALTSASGVFLVSTYQKNPLSIG